MTSSGKFTYTTRDEDESVHNAYEQARIDVEASLGREYPLLIDGKERRTRGPFTVRSPIDSRILIGYFQAGGQEEIREAITAAVRAFPAWESIRTDERVHIIETAAGELERIQYFLAALITLESGKNRAESLAEVSEAIDMLTYYAGIYRGNGGYRVPAGRESGDEGASMSVLRPYGAWAVISPFNFPVALAAGMIGAALLTGNTVVFKPSSDVPLSAWHLCSAFFRAGVPGGALHYITGPGASFGREVTANRDIAGIAFTGSRDTGMRLHRDFCTLQPYHKPFIAEMGSKNPVIIMAGANLDTAIEGVTRSAFGYGGQKCSAASRLYVESVILGRVLERLKERVGMIVVGDPREREVFIGPVINDNAVHRFRAAVADAKESGAQVVIGGEVLTGDRYPGGNYVTPTIITGLTPEHPLWQSELFLPILLVDSFVSLPEAVECANATDYGLTAGIFSGRSEEIDYFFAHIRSGVCYANRRGGATTGAWPGRQSFGGWNASGSTGKGSGGPYYLLSYMREQSQTR